MEKQSCPISTTTLAKPGSRPFIIAGPCSAESEEQLLQTATSLPEGMVDVLRAGIWKPRTRPGCFEGVGESGLSWLKAAGNAANIPVSTEVAKPEHVEACLKAGIDMVWIGARTTANPFAVQDLADALSGVDIPVFVKNPVNPDIELWVGAFERLNRVGVTCLHAIHRGFSTYKKGTYRNDPKWRIPIELKRRHPEIPIICDPSHICGNRELLESVAHKSLDLLFNGIMIECHPDPANALSDAAQQVNPEQLKQLLSTLVTKKATSTDGGFIRFIEEQRERIEDIDDALIKLLSRRMEHAREIGRLKRQLDVSILQPEYWKRLVDNRIEAGKRQGLNEHFVLRLFQYLHEESIRHQEAGATAPVEFEE